jgi:hypothetical protein
VKLIFTCRGHHTCEDSIVQKEQETKGFKMSYGRCSKNWRMIGDLILVLITFGLWLIVMALENGNKTIGISWLQLVGYVLAVIFAIPVVLAILAAIS